MTNNFIYWIAAALLGALVGGVGGIVSEYKRAPFSVFFRLPGFVYLLCNAVASTFALALIYAFGWGPQGTNSSANVEWIRAILAGVGGVMLFRTTLIVGSNRRAIGLELSQFLENILSAAKLEIDRADKSKSVEKVQEIMRNVSFEKAHIRLPRFCAYLMDMSDKEQKKLGETVKTLYDQQMENQHKTILLGVALIEIVGEKILRQAVESIGDKIKE